MQKNKAFTLVELIVVITILAILSTIGFVSFSGYLAGTRDTNRISQLKSMSDALELYKTKKDLPFPDDKVDIKTGTKVIGYQGYIGKNVLETIEYTESGLDPKDKKYFSYYLTKDKKYFQLMALLEEENNDIIALNNFNKIFATDYSDRNPFVNGKRLGILLDENNNPIQEISTITGSGYINLNDVGTSIFKGIIGNDEIVSGTGNALSISGINGSCKRLRQLKGALKSGTYTIDPFGNGIGEKVYCDMETEGGGWTLVYHIPNEAYTAQLTIDSVNSTNLLTGGYGKLSNALFEKLGYKYTKLELIKERVQPGEDAFSDGTDSLSGKNLYFKKMKLGLRGSGGGVDSYNSGKVALSRKGDYSIINYGATDADTYIMDSTCLGLNSSMSIGMDNSSTQVIKYKGVILLNPEMKIWVR